MEGTQMSDREWFKNNGKMPAFVEGKRIMVELRNGLKPAESWPADGRGGCQWKLTRSPFDIVRFAIV